MLRSLWMRQRWISAFPPHTAGIFLVSALDPSTTNRIPLLRSRPRSAGRRADERPGPCSRWCPPSLPAAPCFHPCSPAAPRPADAQRNRDRRRRRPATAQHPGGVPSARRAGRWWRSRTAGTQPTSTWPTSAPRYRDACRYGYGSWRPLEPASSVTSTRISSSRTSRPIATEAANTPSRSPSANRPTSSSTGPL